MNFPPSSLDHPDLVDYNTFVNETFIEDQQTFARQIGRQAWNAAATNGKEAAKQAGIAAALVYCDQQEALLRYHLSQNT